jgi:hypothetical protein
MRETTKCGKGKDFFLNQGRSQAKKVSLPTFPVFAQISPTAAVRTVLARESALLEMVRRVLAEELPGRGGIIAVRTRERLGDSIGVSLAFVSLFHEKA